MIKIQPSGDYVQLIYVDPVQQSVQQELKSDTDAFECSYDSDGKLFLQFGAMRFENPDPTDFTINGSAVTDAADFITKINALFTGGSGGSATIYTGDGELAGDRTIDVDGHDFLIQNGVGTTLLSISQTDAQNIISQQQDANQASLDLEGSNVNPHITLDVTDGTADAQIGLSAKTGDNVEFNVIAYTTFGTGVSIIGDAIANTITFVGAVILPTSDPHIVGALWNDSGTPAISTG